MTDHPTPAPARPLVSRWRRRVRLLPPWLWLLILFAASIGGSIALNIILNRWLDIDPERIRAWLEPYGWQAPLLYVAFIAVAVVISPIPSSPVMVASGLVFGMTWGVVWSLAGSELGAIVAFFLSRRLARPLVLRWAPPTIMTTVDRIADRRGFVAIFVMRLLPLFSFDWVSYAAGLSAIRFAPFALATFAGMTPPVIAIVAVGATLPSSPLLAGTILALLVVILVLPLTSRRFRMWASGHNPTEGNIDVGP